MTNEDAAGLIAALMAKAEDDVRGLRDSVRDLPDAFEQIATMPNVSTLKTLKYATKIDAIFTQTLADLYALHSDMTVDAVASGIESVLPQPRGGTR